MGTQLNQVLRDSGVESMVVSEDCLTIQFLNDWLGWERSFEALVPLVSQQIQEMKKDVRSQMHDTWEEMTRAIEDKCTRSVHLAILGTYVIPIDIFDSEGTPWDSKGARSFDSEVRRVYARA
ncbi:hypothetical protein PIIN_08235 [Serendipita indica DSM 11827]|uniref:Uncharacterized protein n=1 Tax=Serendipita indica (strain DSM 11827) TaxID=1109443 RepID=G4TSI9_SERID|nr:hypothetical protein PIIN_08235 [Serendipita indica DSM 11827]